MQLSDLRTAIQALGYGSDTETEQNYFINQAYREVCSSDRWQFLEAQNTSGTITVNNNTAPLPTDANGGPAVMIDAVRLGIGAPTNSNYQYNLDNVEPEAMRDLETDFNDVVGTPEKWSIIANEFHFWPYPDQTYNIYVDYSESPADLVNDADVPVIPAQFHDILVFYAAKILAQRERDIYSAEQWDNVYQQKMQKMREAYLLRQRQTSSTVKKSGYYDRRPPNVVWW